MNDLFDTWLDSLRLSFTASLLVFACVAAPMQGAVIVAPWLDGGTGVLQDSSVSTGSGVSFTITDSPAASLSNLTSSFFTASSSGSRYLRLSLDFRNYDLLLRSGGGTGFNFYTPLATNGTPANFILSNNADGWSTSLSATFNVTGGITTTITAATGDGTPPGGYSISNGLTPGMINWLMLRPDGASSAAPLQADNTSAYDSAGVAATSQAQRAVAFGFLWTDANNDNLLDGGDTITSRWLVTANTFAEMDTVAELNAAIAVPEPATYAAMAGLAVLGLTTLRRRRPTAA